LDWHTARGDKIRLVDKRVRGPAKLLKTPLLKHPAQIFSDVVPAAVPIAAYKNTHYINAERK